MFIIYYYYSFYSLKSDYVSQNLLHVFNAGGLADNLVNSVFKSLVNKLSLTETRDYCYVWMFDVFRVTDVSYSSCRLKSVHVRHIIVGQDQSIPVMRRRNYLLKILDHLLAVIGKVHEEIYHVFSSADVFKCNLQLELHSLLIVHFVFNYHYPLIASELNHGGILEGDAGLTFGSHNLDLFMILTVSWLDHFVWSVFLSGFASSSQTFVLSNSNHRGCRLVLVFLVFFDLRASSSRW